MKIFICANNYTDKQNEETLKCVEVLRKLGHECSVLERSNTQNKKALNECELIVSLGGDGALLSAAKIALEADKPLMGINSGRLGYLCAMKIEEIEEFDSIFKQTLLEERSILETEYDNEKYYALNDVIVSKVSFGQTADLKVFVNSSSIMNFRGDGVIVSTPTGSTAYNKSAGGPVLDSREKLFVITPICSHDSNVYPHVVDDDKCFRISINHGEADVHVDGIKIKTITDEINIRKSDKKLKLYIR